MPSSASATSTSRTTRPTVPPSPTRTGSSLWPLPERWSSVSDEIGCVSTGNVGTATAALAAKAGLRPYIFYPANLERAKARSCRALGAQVCELDGNYDEANRACRDLALASGIEFANITLRPFYAEGAKTLAFEVVEQLEWRSPDHIVMPAAGGTLSSRVHKGLNELEIVGLAQTTQTKLHVGQPTAARRSPPRSSRTARRSCRRCPRRLRTRWRSALPATVLWWSTRSAVAAALPRRRRRRDHQAMELLAATEGVLTEPAGGTTLSATMKLAQQGVIAPERRSLLS